MVQILPLEKRKEDEQRGGEGRRQEKGSGVLFWVAGVRGEGERGGGIYGAHAGIQNTLRLKLESKTPVGAKLE